MSSTLYVDTQAKELYIFANDKDFIDCDTIHSQIYEKIQDDKEHKNISLEELQSYKPSLFLDSALLLGSSEIETNPFLFGELDKDNTIKQDTPSYYFSPKDEENNLGTLL
ncbi:lipase, partial [Helicobacter japonicus]